MDSPSGSEDVGDDCRIGRYGRGPRSRFGHGGIYFGKGEEMIILKIGQYFLMAFGFIALVLSILFLIAQRSDQKRFEFDQRVRSLIDERLEFLKKKKKLKPGSIVWMRK